MLRLKRRRPWAERLIHSFHLVVQRWRRCRGRHRRAGIDDEEEFLLVAVDVSTEVAEPTSFCNDEVADSTVLASLVGG